MIIVAALMHVIQSHTFIANAGCAMHLLWCFVCCPQIFNDMDRKGEGRIGFPELKAYLARNKPQLATMAYSMFRTLDKVCNARWFVL